MQFRGAVLRSRLALATEQAQVERLVAERAEERQAIEVRLGEQRQLLSSVNGQVQQLVAAEQAAQQAAALQASQAAVAVAAAAQTQASQSFAAAAGRRERRDARGGHRRAALELLGSRRRRDVLHRDALRLGRRLAGRVRLLGARDVRLPQVGVSLPHSSYAMWIGGSAGTEVTSSSPATSSSSTALGHVGIYIGGGEFVHAPHTGTDRAGLEPRLGLLRRRLRRRTPHRLGARGRSRRRRGESVFPPTLRGDRCAQPGTDQSASGSSTSRSGSRRRRRPRRASRTCSSRCSTASA